MTELKNTEITESITNDNITNDNVTNESITPNDITSDGCTADSTPADRNSVPETDKENGREEKRGCRRGPHKGCRRPDGFEGQGPHRPGFGPGCHGFKGMPGPGMPGRAPFGPHHMGRPFPPMIDPDSLLGLWIRSHKALERRPMEYRGTRRVLRLLDLGGGSLSQRDLTELMGVMPGSLSELLGKMEARGLITRIRLEEDRRKVTVSLTEAGKEKAAERGRRDIFATLNDEEKEQLKTLLAKLTAAWEDRPEAARKEAEEE